MTVKKLCILHCAFFLLCGICHGQTEKDFMDYYQQYRMVKSHDHSLLLELPIAEPFVSYAMKLFYHDGEVDMLRFHNRSPKKYIVEDSCRFVSLEDAGVHGATGGNCYFLTVEQTIVGTVKENQVVWERKKEIFQETIWMLELDGDLYIIGDPSLENLYVLESDL